MASTKKTTDANTTPSALATPAAASGVNATREQRSNSTSSSNSSNILGGSNATRHTSIVEMLSTPPQLPHHHHHHHHHNGSSSSHYEAGTANANSNEIANLHRTESGSSAASMSSLSISSSHEMENAPISETSSLVGGTHPVTVQSLLSMHSQKWQYISLSQLIEQNKLITVSGSISIEEAFNTLVKHHLRSLPVEAYEGDMNCFTFDYNDLNAYLLLVLNRIKINNKEITQDCQSGKPVAVGEIVKLMPKNPFYKLPETENLSTVMGILGSGVHRVAITDVKMVKIKGILSQRRLIKYIWDNARSFDGLEALLNLSIQDLKIGVINANKKQNPVHSQSRVISIQGEEPLIMALHKMYSERISSIAVVDNQANLIGNISVTDVKHVTRTSQYPLLHNTCRHFISVILNSRGLEMGKDSFPIFHVYPTSSLARTMAKLVATKSHRLWIVQPPEFSEPSSISAKKSSANAANPATSPMMTAIADNTSNASSSSISLTSATNVAPTNLFEKEYRAGKLIGVVSLTDILSMLARRQTENKQVDPQSARRQRGSVAH